MKKMLNRMVSMSFVLMLLCSFATIHAAVPDEGIMPMYTYISDAGCAMEINGSRAVMNAYVYGDFDKAQIKMTLQILDGSTWRNVTSWAITEEMDYPVRFQIFLSIPHSINPGFFRGVSSCPFQQ